MNILKILKAAVNTVIGLSKSGVIRGEVGKIAKDIDPDLIPKVQGLVSINNSTTIKPVVKVIPVDHKLPKEYQWIEKIGQLPKTMEIAFSFCGLLEKRGPDDNPTIIEWAKEVGVGSIYNHDSIAWCGLGQAVPVKRSGYNPPPRLLAAKGWAVYGTPVQIKDVRFGDIVVLNRDNNPELGHVTRYIGHDGQGNFCGYGANQSDSWCFAWFSMSRVFTVRRDPFKFGPPPSMKNYLLNRTGELSKNEA